MFLRLQRTGQNPVWLEEITNGHALSQEFQV